MAITIRHFPGLFCPYLRMLNLTTRHHRDTWKTIRCIASMPRIGSTITRATSPRNASTRRCTCRKLSEASMKRHIPGILLGIFFVLLIAVPVVLKRVSAPHAPGGAARDTVIERYGFYFQEVARAAGI